MDNKLFEILENQDWEDIITKMNAYAFNQIKRYQWRTKSGIPPKGITHYDIVNEAIKKIWEEKRTWNYESINVVTALRKIIESLVSNLFKSKEHKTTDNTEINDTKTISLSENIDDELNNKELISLVEDVLSNDDDALEVFYAILENNSKPKEISDALDIPISDVYNRLKRIRRKIKPVKDNYFKTSLSIK